MKTKHCLVFLLISVSVKSQSTQTSDTCLFCSVTSNSTNFNDCLAGDVTTNVTVPSGYQSICSTTVVYSGLASATDNPQNMEAIQVIRSIPTLQLEYERRVVGGSINSTGTICSAIGDILKCTKTCYGVNCNNLPIDNLDQIKPYQQLCTSCTELEGSPEFDGCLAGTNATLEDVGQIAVTHNDGNGFASKQLSGMCVTIVNYNSSGYPVAIDRKASGVSSSLLPTPKDLNFTTLAQCQLVDSDIRGDLVETMTCVKGTLQFLDLDEFDRPTDTYSNVMPAPTNKASCYTCSAMMNEVEFEYCKSPNNFTENELLDAGVGISYCPLPINRKTDTFWESQINCFVMSLFSEDGSEVLGIQRGCVPPAYWTHPDNAPSTCYNGNEHVVNVNQTKVCISQCNAMNSTIGACNDYSNTFSEHTSGLKSVSVSVSLIVVFAIANFL